MVVLAASAQTMTPLSGMPLYFEANRGQADHSAQFIARGCNSQFLISPAGAQIVLRQEAAAPVTMRMQFMGANPQAQIRGDAEQAGKINYLTGNDPARWHTGVPTFAQVRVEEVYPGIGLVYYGNQQQLEYDFAVAPGAEPGAIKMHFDGADKIAVNAQGELVLTLAGGEIHQPKPVIYQMANGARHEISGGYRLLDAHTVAFAVGNYDQSLPLVIDPILSYSTYFGGNAGEIAWAVKVVNVGTNNFVYVAGQTFSSKFTNNVPLSTFGAYQTNYNGGTLAGDAFVAKFDSLGSNLLYFTYLGGSGDDAAYALAVDITGDAYVTGYTVSTNFPVTNAIPGGATIAGPIDRFSHTYLADAFVAELNTNGSSLVYSTYLGGAGADAAYSIALDSSNNAYVTGFTYSTNFPTSTNAFQKHLGVTNSVFSSYYNANAFVSEIGAGGTNLLYSSFLGGTNYDWGRGIAVDSSNYVYVTGFTASTNFPTTNAVQQQLVSVTFTTNSAPTNEVFTTNFVNGYLLNGATNQTFNYDAFVTKFNPSFAGLVYSTFLGGTNNDEANSIAVDSVGNAYVTGWTVSTNFPDTVTNANLYNGLTNNVYYGYNVTTNAFLTKIINSSSGQAGIAYSTVFGGTNLNTDIGYGVALDPAGDAFVVGTTSSTNFPVTTNNLSGFLRATNSGGNDVFVIAFNTNASAVLYSAYLGGSSDDFGYGIAVDPLGNAYVVGQTLSANFPTLNARQTTLNGTNDAFLARIISNVLPPVITVSPTNQTVGVSSNAIFSVTVTSGTPPFSYQWQVEDTNGVWTNLVNGEINGGTISGATNATLAISDVQTNNGGIIYTNSYQVIVTNFAGSVTSAPVSLTVMYFPPYLTLQPLSQTVGVGSSVSFSVDGIAQLPRVLQWQKSTIVGTTNLTDGTNTSGSVISGSTSAGLTISNVQTNDAGDYTFVVTNYGGSVTSSVATLTVVAFPTITVPPTNRTVTLGTAVSFAVTAVGAAPLTYRWQENGTDLVNAGRIGPVTNNVLTITNAQTSDDGGYSVIVTNMVGSVTSSPPAVLTVLTSPLFESILVAGGTNGGFILSGVGGSNSATYYVLTTTNLALPLTNWMPIATNQFDSLGSFIFTNVAQTNVPQQFFILEQP